MAQQQQQGNGNGNGCAKQFATIITRLFVVLCLGVYAALWAFLLLNGKPGQLLALHFIGLMIVAVLAVGWYLYVPISKSNWKGLAFRILIVMVVGTILLLVIVLVPRGIDRLPFDIQYTIDSAYGSIVKFFSDGLAGKI